MLSLPEPGQLVDVRRRRYVVLEVTESMLTADAPAVALPRQHLVTLSSVEDDTLGEEVQVLWEGIFYAPHFCFLSIFWLFYLSSARWQLVARPRWLSCAIIRYIIICPVYGNRTKPAATTQ